MPITLNSLQGSYNEGKYRGQAPDAVTVNSSVDNLNEGYKKADELYGGFQEMPLYDPAKATAAANSGGVDGYEGLLNTIAAAYAPKGETEKEKRNRRINDYIAALGDVLTHGLNAASGATGGNVMTLDPSTSLSAQAKARYDKTIAANQAARDKYLSLLMKAADLHSTSSTNARSIYDKAYDAEVKRRQAHNTAHDNYAKAWGAAMDNDSKAQTVAYNNAVKSYENGQAYNQRWNMATRPKTSTSSANYTVIDNLGDEHNLTRTTTTTTR